MQRLNRFKPKITYIIYACIVAFYIRSFIPFYKIDPELSPYFNEYMVYVNKYCTEKQYSIPIQRTIQIGVLGGDNIGLCAYNLINRYTITFDTNSFKIMDNDARFEIIAHEGNHFLFHVKHSMDTNNFMNPYYVNLPKDIVIKQLEIFLKEQCK